MYTTQVCIWVLIKNMDLDLKRSKWGGGITTPRADERSVAGDLENVYKKVF